MQDTLDKMGDKVEEAKKRWLSESREIQETNKQLLLAFGLNPLDIWLAWWQTTQSGVEFSIHVDQYGIRASLSRYQGQYERNSSGLQICDADETKKTLANDPK